MGERMPVYLAAQVRAAETPLLEAGEPLMRRAAAALARVAAEQLGATGERVLVLAGSGDNGGDALFAGAALAEFAEVDVFLTSDRFHEQALAEAVATDARKVDLPEVVAAASDYDLILDGILGIGASGTLRGTARTVVEALLPAVHAGRPRVIAVDVPSGLHPDTGASDGVVLPASVTVTFGAVKAGLVRGDGAELAGSVVLVDLGLGLVDEPTEGEASVAAVVQG